MEGVVKEIPQVKRRVRKGVMKGMKGKRSNIKRKGSNGEVQIKKKSRGRLEGDATGVK